MPRYFYTIKDGPTERDDSGTELAGDEHARRELVRFACEVVRDEPHRLMGSGHIELELRDEQGRLVEVVRIALQSRQPD